MNWWLLITPLVAWLIAGTWGVSLIRRTPESLWNSAQLRTSFPPYNPDLWRHRFFAYFNKTVGWLLIVVASFITIMSILVAVGVVPPASS